MNKNQLKRLEKIEEIVLEMGDGLRSECDYRWFSLGDLLNELEDLREGNVSEQHEDSEQ